jgi:hypothetical protein
LLIGGQHLLYVMLAGVLCVVLQIFVQYTRYVSVHGITNIQTSSEAAEALRPIAGPIQALFWSAVINGVVAVPVMVLMMLLTANTKIMGQFTATGVLRFTGWLATAVMAAAVVGMLVTAVL